MRQGNARWLIAAAVEQEIQGIRRAVHGQPDRSHPPGTVWSGQWKGEPLLLVRTGVGPKKARETLAPCLSGHPCRGVVSTGYAGGLRDGYELGDILVPAELTSVPPLPETCIHPDPELREIVLRAAEGGPWRIHTSRMITTDRVIFSSDEKHRLGLEYDAGSVDMESAVVGELAVGSRVPFVVVRVVLDEARFSLPDLLEVVRWWRRRQYGRLIPHLVLRPAGWLALVRLLRRSRLASQGLTDFFLTCLLDGLQGAEAQASRPQSTQKQPGEGL